MTKNHKAVILVCVLLIAVNITAKFFFIDNQKNMIQKMQRDLASVRKIASVEINSESSKYTMVRNDINKAVKNLHHVFTFTEQAGKIGTIIDRNRLYLQKSMLFKSEKSERLFLTK